MSSDDFKPNETVVKELEKVNKVWNNLVENIHQKPNKDRVSAILVQVMIEYYIDRVLIINEIDSKEKIYDIRYDLKLQKLKELNLINSDLEDDLLRIYKIRNIYSHEIEIHEKQVLDLINEVKTIRNPTRFDENERVGKVTDIILRQIGRMFMELLVRKQEKSDNCRS